MVREFLLRGLALGFGSGMSPGPFLALVVSSSLRGGFRHGAAVALAPLVSDLPVILASMLLLSQLPQQVLAALSMLGAVVLAWYAYESFRDARAVSLVAMRANAGGTPPARDALRRGVLVNLLNPNPWMFWITIGGPLLVSARDAGAVAVLAFMLPFYGLLIGSKVAIAAAIGAGRSRLTDRGYRLLLAGAGSLLLVLAGSLMSSGIRMISGA